MKETDVKYFVGFVLQVKDRPHPIIEIDGSGPSFTAGQLIRVEQLGQGWFQATSLRGGLARPGQHHRASRHDLAGRRLVCR